MKNQSVSDFVAATMDAVLNSKEHKSLFGTQYKFAQDLNDAKKKKDDSDKDSCMADDDNDARKKKDDSDKDSCMADDDNDARKKKDSSDESSADMMTTMLVRRRTPQTSLRLTMTTMQRRVRSAQIVVSQ